MTRRRWRDYQTARGTRPVRDFLRSLKKKTQKTPSATIALAQRRLRDWRARARGSMSSEH